MDPKKSVSNVTDPVIDFDGIGNLFFCYLHRLELQVYVLKSTDLGTTWSLPKKVSNAGSEGADKEWIAIDRTNNFIYLVWWEPEGIISALKFSRSTDGGNSFSQPDNLYTSSYSICAPYITVGTNGRIYVSFTVIKNFRWEYATFDIGLLKSSDNGVSFGSATIIDSNIKPPGFYTTAGDDPWVLKMEETNNQRAFRIYPINAMAANDQNIYIIVSHKETKNYTPGLTYTDNSDLVLYKSSNDGLTWNKKRIYDYGANVFKKDGDQFFPSLTCTDNGVIYCLFYNSLIEGSTGNLDTKMSLAYSTDGAESFKIFDADEQGVFDPSLGSPAALRFNGEYIQISSSTDKIVMSYSKPYSDSHRLTFQTFNLNNNTTVYNDVNSAINLGDIYVDDVRKINLPQTIPLPLSYHSIESPNLVNEWKFYKWQSELDPALNDSRIKKDNFIANINKTIKSKFERTKPLNIRNYFEGGNGKTILFGEKNFDVTTRTSPHLENAFIYQPQVVEATYQAFVVPTYTGHLGTNWYFQNWENGSTSLKREEQISSNTSPEWRAIYKGIQRSDRANAYANNSQRKFVRGFNQVGGGFFNTYTSMDKVWLEFNDNSSGGNNWQIMNNGKPLSDNESKNPSVDYWEKDALETFAFVVYQEKKYW